MKRFFLAGIIILAAAFFSVYLLRNLKTQSKASPANVLDTTETTAESFVSEEEKTIDFSLHKEDGYLFKTSGSGSAAVLEFLNKDPQYKPEEVPNASQEVKGASTQSEPRRLIPRNFAQNSYLARRTPDEVLDAAEHFFYQQKIKNTPVYGGVLAVHLKNSNEVYSVDASLVMNETLRPQNVTEGRAKEIALARAKEQAHKGTTLSVAEVRKYVFNKKILGIGGDETNYLTLSVVVVSEGQLAAFGKKYFVDLTTGDILHTEGIIQEALQRTIYNCAGGETSCPLARSEGQAPTGDADIDNTYSILGDVYNFYKNSFGRDSYNGQGVELRALVNLSTQPSAGCPNAFWAGAPFNYIAVCDGLVANDVLAHEMTHAVTENTADLVYSNQSGALNESVSDIFAYAIDSDWTLGEDTVLGIVRYLDDPTKPPGNQPDRLFSANYYCGTEDEGGVHHNSGVMNKAFYLMTVGGSFNGCSIAGVGKEKSHPIIYRALTVYLTPTADFKSMYTAILQACGDLYQSSSDTCNQVKRALQAVEMDQQPEGTQTSPKCSNVQPATPQCVTGGSPTVSPTQPAGVSPTATGTVVPTQPNETPTATPTPTSTPTPTATPTPTPTPDMFLYLDLKFQGIMSKPKDQYNKMSVKATIAGKSVIQPFVGRGDFIADEKGIWSGMIGFSGVPEGSYYLLVKGPQHMQKKVCSIDPSETFPGTYSCSVSELPLRKGEQGLDFSKITLLVGDLPDQDGIVNSYDTSVVLNTLGKSDAESLKKADLNHDGAVNAQDYSLVTATLSIRLDEE